MGIKSALCSFFNMNMPSQSNLNSLCNGQDNAMLKENYSQGSNVTLHTSELYKHVGPIEEAFV